MVEMIGFEAVALATSAITYFHQASSSDAAVSPPRAWFGTSIRARLCAFSQP